MSMLLRFVTALVLLLCFAADAHAAETGGEGGLVSTIAKVLNFAILVGVLVYFLKSPIAAYLASRSAQIRQDLVNAAEMKTAAAAEREAVEAKMRALPGELEGLKAQGAEDVRAERARMAEAADAERKRLLEHTRREIESRLRMARRELTAYAADLAVGVARTRIEQTITPDDQLRLVDRYAGQLKGAR